MENRYRRKAQLGRRERGETRELHSRTGLFMMELILAILFFAIGAACCLQVFARASNISREAKQLKLAVNTAENLVQLLKAGKLEILCEEGQEKASWEGLSWKDGENTPLEEGQEGMPGDLLFYYNQEGGVCSRSEADYQAFVSVERGELLTRAAIACTRLDGQEIYTLSTAFVPEVYHEKEE